jgi:hypothetical protein
MITAILITLIMIAMVGVAGAEDGHGMVASVHPTAMEAGLGVLKLSGGDCLNRMLASPNHAHCITLGNDSWAICTITSGQWQCL